MAEVKWTADQRAAIEHRGSSLIVSAAAGSGKTAVLVERVIERILDKKDPCDIDELLIVTYTNAASSEMRVKIGDALSDRIAKGEGRGRLRRQMALIHKAHIQTVHTFCLDLIRKNFHLISGLSPDFRLLSETEADMLKEKAMEEVLEKKYENIDRDGDFSSLCELLSGERNDRKLEDTILDAYTKIQSHPYPGKWLRKSVGDLDLPDISDIADTKWGRFALSRALSIMEEARDGLLWAISQIEGKDEIRSKYSPAFYENLDSCEKVIASIKTGKFEETFELLSGISFPKLSAVRGFDDKTFLSRIQEKNRYYKDAVDRIRKKIIFTKCSDVIDDIERIKPAARALYDTVCDFARAFEKEKKSRKAVDFSDLEHMAVSLLVKEDSFETGNIVKTPLAEMMSDEFVEIMVDEYQDSNEVQDLIFSALSREPGNVFMVGDVKQSIYRFRLAQPEIFLNKYLSYKDADKAAEGENARISLTKNFRSRGGVIDAVNAVFSRVMSEKLGEIDYNERERLREGAGMPDDSNETYRPELYMIDMKNVATDEDEDLPQKAEIEAKFAAMRIKKLIDDKFPVYDKGSKIPRPVQKSDIVILLRTVKNKAVYYEEALEKMGISCRSDTGADMFDTTEVKALTSLLAVLDNPHQDIPLISLLRSPFYCFSADDLVKIRLLDENADFFDALLKSAEEHGGINKKVVSDIEDMRSQVFDMNAYEFLWHVFERTNALGIFGAMENGDTRRQNLMNILEYAKEYEKAGFRGLYSFLSFLDKIKERETQKPSENTADDAVRIMSIHKSKGLEFPVVLMADLDKKFNEDDIKKPVLFHSNLGIGMRGRDNERMIDYPTLMHASVLGKIRADALSEEMRAMYVAMTRAREKLIMTCAVPNFEKTVEKYIAASRNGAISTQRLLDERSCAMWIALPLMCASGFLNDTIVEGERSPAGCKVHIEVVDGKSVILGKNKMAGCGKAEKDINIGAERDNAFGDVKSRIKFIYPHVAATRLPSKITPTQIKGRFGDFEAAEYTADRPRRSERSEFLIEKPTAQTPAQRGIAQHLMMQLADLDSIKNEDDAKKELDRLISKGILSKMQGSAVDIKGICGFLNSEIGERMRNAGKVLREFKFSLMVPAEDIFSDGSVKDEKIMMQGVIDMLLFEKDGISIIDFKTDAVSYPFAEYAAKKYESQIKAYKYAMEKITGEKVKDTILYFFATGQAVFLK